MLKAFMDGLVGNNSKKEDIAQDKTERLTEELLQAFYRREYDTVDLLSEQGAKFTEEMLLVATKLRDQQLIMRCLHGGITPNEKMIHGADMKKLPEQRPEKESFKKIS